MKFKFFVKYLLLAPLAGMMFLVSCNPTPPDDPTPPEEEGIENVFIMYEEANNNLENALNRNIEAVMEAVDYNFPKNSAIYVFWRGKAKSAEDINKAQLYKIVPPDNKTEKATKEIVKEYSDIVTTTNPEVMKMVLNDIKADTDSKAKHYGISLGSHGGGWFPAGMSPAQQRTPGLSGAPAGMFEHDLAKPEEAEIMTRWFGQDGSMYMSVASLVEGLSVIDFDFVLFDACFMSSVEVLYDMRNLADYIIASPVEIIDIGFPYVDIIPILFNTDKSYTLEKKLTDSCKVFVDYYMAKQGLAQSAAIALIDTDKIDALAQSVKNIFAGQTKEYTLDDIQYLERINPHAFYDLHDYLYNLCDDAALFGAFENALSGVTIYEAHTPKIYSAYNRDGQFSADRVCGISSYIPRINYPVAYTAYYNTAWAKFTQPSGGI